ncbi:MAG TPA: hypothetical protein VFP35_04325 [Candidatus Saccharimonadales bacterium]|nr:hypothetical protein [Candidatus Saccharimonadales bacterium]
MKKQILRGSSAYLAEQKALLTALSNDLTLPLLQIRSSLELLAQADYPKKMVANQARLMALSADNGLQLTEAYRMVLQVDKLHELPLEPIAIGAVLDEVAHQLYAYAKEYSTQLEVDVQTHLTPVLANRASLDAALNCLSTSLIRAQAAQAKQGSHRLILGAHRARGNEIAAGVFTNMQGLSDRTLRAARSLAGQARQPLPALPDGAVSGVLIADVLCAAMWKPLRSAAHRHMSGLVVGVPASKQLQFV